MAIDYSALLASATSLISENGRTVTLERTVRTNTTGKPWEPATETVQQQSVSAVWAGYNGDEIDGTLILAGDAKVLISPSGLSWLPETDCRIVDGSDTWRIVNVETVKPGATSVLLKCQVRR